MLPDRQGPRPAWISIRSAATTPGTRHVTLAMLAARLPVRHCGDRPESPWQRPHPGHARRGPPSPGTLNRPAFRPQRSPGLVHLAPAPPAPRQSQPLPAKTSPLQRSAAGVSRPKTLRSLGRPFGAAILPLLIGHAETRLGPAKRFPEMGRGADLRDVPDRRHGQPEPGPLTMLILGGNLRIAGRGSRTHRVVSTTGDGPCRTRICTGTIRHRYGPPRAAAPHPATPAARASVRPLLQAATYAAAAPSCKQQ